MAHNMIQMQCQNHDVYYNFLQMEFNIIKLLDGIFIANRSVITDYEFVANNKISHLIACLNQPLSLNNICDSAMISEKQALEIMRMMGINQLIFQNQNNVPDPLITQSCINAINQSRDEQLCCLIISDRILDTLWLIAPYLKCRYNWSFRTAIGFIQRKIYNFSIPDMEQVIDSLKNQLIDLANEGSHQNYLMREEKREKPLIHSNDIELDPEESFVEFMEMNRIESAVDSFNGKNYEAGKQIYWEDSSFLAQYQTDNIEELLLVNTIKNLKIDLTNESNKTAQKRTKRVKWTDQKGKNSLASGQKLFANSRINNSLKKNQSIINMYSYPQASQINQKPNYRPSSSKLGILQAQSKPKLKSVLKEIEGEGHNPRHEADQEKTKKVANETNLKVEKQLSIFDDPAYYELKELSRTNFADLVNVNRRYSRNKRKIGQKTIKPNKYSISRINHSLNKQNTSKLSGSIVSQKLAEPFSSTSNLCSNKSRLNINNLTLNFNKKDDDNTIPSLKSIQGVGSGTKLRRNEKIKLRS